MSPEGKLNNNNKAKDVQGGSDNSLNFLRTQKKDSTFSDK